MKKVFVTGIGFVSSIGHGKSQVAASLRELVHGFEPIPEAFGDCSPVSLYGSIKDFDTHSPDPEDWIFPDKYRIPRMQLKTMSPNVLYAHFAMRDALEDAGLELEAISDPRTGLYTASAGSPYIQHHQLGIMDKRGVMRCLPYGVVASTVGTITFNLGASLKIQGATCGMASACASSAHAIGFAFDEIALGRQDRMLVVGAEDGNRESILPFASMRALSEEPEATRASCPFDQDRSGFVGTGGACALILESEAVASSRGKQPIAELLGWGQASDGHSPAMSHPEGAGLVRSMQNALDACQLSASEVDYVNAHATSTLVGDLSEIKALKAVFDPSESRPWISSTKALTGHGLSLAGALEAGICCLAMEAGFTPGSAHIENLDPEAAGLKILQETRSVGPEMALSNSSGFGGSNVSLVFKTCAR